jgi:hypothetical protein
MVGYKESIHFDGLSAAHPVLEYRRIARHPRKIAPGSLRESAVIGTTTCHERRHQFALAEERGIRDRGNGHSL